MGKGDAAFAGKAWRLLRLTLLWARKGVVVKRGLIMPDLRLLPGYIKSFRAARSDMFRYGERQFSLEETPVFRFKASRAKPSRMFHIPCISPAVEFDDDLDGRDSRENYSYLPPRGGPYAEEDEEDDLANRGGTAEVEGNDPGVSCGVHQDEGTENGGKFDVDVKAEEFIAKFYARMRLQRQISLLKYSEMLARSTS